MPSEIEQVSEVTEPPDKLQTVSLEEKPEPDTCTFAPTCAETAFSVIDIVPPLTVKVTEAESPFGAPVAVIV
ncbi:MAG: hypothetical protein ABSA92_16505 [Candidatus Bathyarchaeia archaeon]